MLKRCITLLIFAMLAAGVFAGLTSAEDTKPIDQNVSPAPSPKGYTTHATIHIYGDINFTTANGVNTGNGTQYDPYIIEGWEITEHYSYLIEIRDTRSYFSIRNCNLHFKSSYGPTGIHLYNVSNGLLINNTIFNNSCGIAMEYTTNISIIYNNIYQNQMGINFYRNCTNNSITYNRISSNHYCVRIEYASMYNLLFRNSICNGTVGIEVDDSIYNTILYNNISDFYTIGLFIHISKITTIWNNTFRNCGIYLEGDSYLDYVHLIPTNNTINGKEVDYLLDRSGLNISGWDSGQIILVNCTDIQISNVSISNTTCPIEVARSSSIRIVNTTLSFSDISIFVDSSSLVNISNSSLLGDQIGIEIYNSSRNIVYNNIIKNSMFQCLYVDNNYIGGSSRYNLIFHNKFISNNVGNGKQAADGSGNNFWNTSIEGNYWSDWTSPDNNSDGIVDFAYHFSGGTDYYPLTKQVLVPDLSPAPAIMLAVILLSSLAAFIRRRSYP